MSTSVSLKNIREVGISDFELGRDLGKGKFGRVKIAKYTSFYVGTKRVG